MELAESTDTVEKGRAGAVGFTNFLVGWGAVGSLGFDFPKVKSLVKNPGFPIFRWANDGLRTKATGRETLTGGGSAGPVFNNDEGGGACCDHRPGILEVEA